MAQKIERFKQGGGATTKGLSGEGPEPMQNLDYSFLSGRGGGGRSMGPQITPTMIRQPSSDLSRISGTAAPRGYGIKITKRFKKGGLAVKPVWDKERPDDLGKPKDLSAKRKKSAKARAKAAGRPYPNLVDNMAAARKKGK
jgi:hypothetical protein